MGRPVTLLWSVLWLGCGASSPEPERQPVARHHVEPPMDLAPLRESPDGVGLRTWHCAAVHPAPVLLEDAGVGPGSDAGLAETDHPRRDRPLP